MTSGHIYKVFDVDQVDSSLWLAPEDVLVCAGTMTMKGQTVPFIKIINKDEQGEEVLATRIQ